jgi:Trk K+ transport system NAD-binding subunit
MRHSLSLVIALGVVLAAAAVVVFHLTLGLAWVDSLYFVVTTVTTVGYGDFNLQAAPPAVKLFGCALMGVGSAVLAAAVALVTDTLVELRLERWFGARRRPMRDHVILCGLGHVGIRVAETLCRLDERVVVIDPAPEPRHVDEAKALGLDVLVGDLRNPAVLARAGVASARSVVCASEDDLANLEVALNARNLAPGIRVVLRMFDPNLAKKVGTGFGFDSTFSTSALSAPAMAMAALGPGIVGSLPIGDRLVLNMELEVKGGSALDGMPAADLVRRGGLAIIAHEANDSKARRLHPADAFTLAPGDRLVVSIERERMAAFTALNEAPAHA